jgi:LPXTG-site transpeptidase (sortase) family protein
MNKKYFPLAAFAVLVLLAAAFPAFAQTNNNWGQIQISPLSGHWNYPGYFVLEAQSAPLFVEWEIKCSYVPCPREEEYGSHTFTYVGETIQVGWGHQCYAWQFDPIGRIGFIAEAEPWLCEDPTPTPPAPTATPVIPPDTPTPTATGAEPTPTAPAETPPGSTPGEPTPTPADETPAPGEPTPTPDVPSPTPTGPTPTPTSGTPEDTPTPTAPPAGEAEGPTPTPRLLLPIAGEMPYPPLATPLWPALAALLLLGLAGRTVWTGILQAERAQITTDKSSDLRSHARNVLILIGLSLLILAYLVWSTIGSRVPADLRDTSAANPPAVVLVQEQPSNPSVVPVEQLPSSSLLPREGAPSAVTISEEATIPPAAPSDAPTAAEAMAGSQSIENLLIPVVGGSTSGQEGAAFSSMAGVYREGSALDASPVTRLVIPALKVDADVRFTPFENETWEVGDLGLDIAWLGNTSSPGLGSNTVLAGHVTALYLGNGPFRYLARLQPGNLVYVHTEWKLYTYSVREQAVVKPNDSRVVGATEDNQLTLITCTGWNDEDRQYINRRAVFADLVSVEWLAEQDGQMWR